VILAHPNSISPTIAPSRTQPGQANSISPNNSATTIWSTACNIRPSKTTAIASAPRKPSDRPKLPNPEPHPIRQQEMDRGYARSKNWAIVSALTPVNLPEFDSKTIDRIIEMAWEDRTTFEAIALQFGLSEKQVITLMRREMKDSSFKMWRKRVSGRKTKHGQQRDFIKGRFRSQNQKGSWYWSFE
jgi:uncharacterized protein (TIGR03643 family)